MTSDRPETSLPTSQRDALWLREPTPVAAVSTWAVAAPTRPVVSAPDLPPPRPPSTLPPPTLPPPTLPPPTLPPPTFPSDRGPFVPGPAGGQAPPTRRGRRGSRWLIEWAVVLVVAVVVAVGIRTFVVQTFYIPSASMEPTLMIGDRILVDKVSYHLHAVHRGDIVVFATPPGEDAGPDVKDLVKRVIGLPGDTISSAGGQVVINRTPLKEPWLVTGTVTTGITTQKVPAGEFFVMGDNRSDSQDSRFFGPIHQSLIVGRVVVKIWPITSFHFY